jgi:hypothetical protein
MNYVVVLVNKLAVSGKVGEFHHHVFRDKAHFEKWFNEEEQEKAFLHKEDISVPNAFKIFTQSPTH